MKLLRLRELRKKNKLTQHEVANRLKVTSDAYSLYELGKRQMNYETLCLLADLYGVSIDFLLGRYETNPVLLDIEEVEVIDKFRLLDRRGRETVKASLTFEVSLVSTKKAKSSESKTTNRVG